MGEKLEYKMVPEEETMPVEGAETEAEAMPDGAAGKEDMQPVLKGNNAGVGVIELILVLVVLVALVLIFKEQLTGMVERAMEALEKSMERILS